MTLLLMFQGKTRVTRVGRPRRRTRAFGPARDFVRGRSLSLPVALSVAGSMAAFVALVLGSLWLFHAAALSEAKQEAGHLGEVTARVAMAPFLTPGLRTGQPADLARMDKAGKAFIATGNVVRLKIWSREGPTPPSLTPRESQILRLIAEGGTNGEIGRRLGISEKTVKAHCSSLFRRLGVTDRTQAAVWATRHLPAISDD